MIAYRISWQNIRYQVITKIAFFFFLELNSDFDSSLDPLAHHDNFLD